MKIVPLYDHGIIRSVMMHEDILPTIIDDTWGGQAYTPNTADEIFLGCIVDGSLIGVYRLHWLTGITLQGHTHILKDYRKEHSIESCKKVMAWVLDNVARCKKIDCYVPRVYPNVRQFLAACGFKSEGITRSSFMLKGRIYDQDIMGITRDEMKQEIK
ncbi:MAG: hypothetical protein COB09_17115 [Thalassobium sp.]|nr:MAG: hypothetical protein COB09_17115 [Thalassobium sp.]